jgi:hypothetical protein
MSIQRSCLPGRTHRAIDRGNIEAQLPGILWLELTRLERPRAKTIHARKLQVVSQPLNDFGAPTLASLPGENIAANRPVEENKLPVDGERSPHLGAADPGLQILELV